MQKIIAKFDKNLRYTLTSVSFAGPTYPTMAECKTQIDKALSMSEAPQGSVSEETKLKVFNEVSQYLIEKTKAKLAAAGAKSRSRSRGGKSDSSKESGEVSGDEASSPRGGRYEKKHRGHSSSRSDYKSSSIKKSSRY